MIDARDSGAPTIRILPFGDRALLVEVDSLAEAIGLYAALDADRAVGVQDLVPAARTVLVVLEPGILTVDAARRWVQQVAPLAPPVAARSYREVHTIEVVYDGADLVELAAALGLAPSQLVELHHRSEWVVAFSGFAPGFAYLSPTAGWPEVPRRGTPRTTVPAGSVAVAGPYCGIYPRASPGGWQLLGRTSSELWDSARIPPALLRPGAIVRFEAIG